jgi:hypothetical protein
VQDDTLPSCDVSALKIALILSELTFMLDAVFIRRIEIIFMHFVAKHFRQRDTKTQR